MSRSVQAYRQTQAQSWTRIDMLLALYSKSIATIELGIQAIEENRVDLIAPTRTKVQRLLLGLIDGLDLQSDETAKQIAQLLIFGLRKVSGSDPAQWRDAIKVLVPLQEAFTSIREEAIRAENMGTIPPLNWHTQYGYTA